MYVIGKIMMCVAQKLKELSGIACRCYGVVRVGSSMNENHFLIVGSTLSFGGMATQSELFCYAYTLIN